MSRQESDAKRTSGQSERRHFRSVSPLLRGATDSSHPQTPVLDKSGANRLSLYRNEPEARPSSSDQCADGNRLQSLESLAGLGCFGRVRNRRHLADVACCHLPVPRGRRFLPHRARPLGRGSYLAPRLPLDRAHLSDLKRPLDQFSGVLSRTWQPRYAEVLSLRYPGGRRLAVTGYCEFFPLRTGTLRGAKLVRRRSLLCRAGHQHAEPAEWYLLVHGIGRVPTHGYHCTRTLHLRPSGAGQTVEQRADLPGANHDLRGARTHRILRVRRLRGSVRDLGFRGPGIEVEVWAMPEYQFGSFVARVPAPLGIGNAVLDDGSTVKSFICEPYAVAGATEITRFGGWKHYLSQALTTR